MMRSCKEVSRLASDRMDRKLTLRERMAFRMHLLMCRNCLRYARQLAILRQATDKLRSKGRPSDPERLSDEARQRIAQRVIAASHQDPRT